MLCTKELLKTTLLEQALEALRALSFSCHLELFFIHEINDVTVVPVFSEFSHIYLVTVSWHLNTRDDFSNQAFLCIFTAIALF